MTHLPPLLISACLLGENVKYDGRNNLVDTPEMKRLQEHTRLIPVCPEVLGGLPVPRIPAEARGGKVIDQTGRDVTAPFQMGAMIALEIARKEGAAAAILKERSPSCGVHEIYDGTFSKTRIVGEGTAAALLRANGIRVFSENEIAQCLAYLESLHN